MFSVMVGERKNQDDSVLLPAELNLVVVLIQTFRTLKLSYLCYIIVMQYHMLP